MRQQDHLFHQVQNLLSSQSIHVCAHNVMGVLITVSQILCVTEIAALICRECEYKVNSVTCVYQFTSLATFCHLKAELEA